jgi:hypothetical protein
MSEQTKNRAMQRRGGGDLRVVYAAPSCPEDAESYAETYACRLFLPGASSSPAHPSSAVVTSPPHTNQESHQVCIEVAPSSTHNPLKGPLHTVSSSVKLWQYCHGVVRWPPSLPQLSRTLFFFFFLIIDP